MVGAVLGHRHCARSGRALGPRASLARGDAARTATLIALVLGLALSAPPPFAAADPPVSRVSAGPLRGFDPLSHREEDGVLVSDLGGGRTAILSLDAGLQGAVAEVLERYEVPWASVVALDPRDGRLLAYVSHSSAEADPGDLARAADAPAASVFKVITAAALLENGVSADERVCFHGGSSSLQLAHLTPSPRLDTRCATLTEALGGSMNAVFARLADQHLQPRVLSRYASAFGWGEALPFDVPTVPSALDMPRERLEFARTAAGFWHSHMSPLHGALVAATIANDGRMMRPSMVDRVLARDGSTTYEFHPSVFRPVIGRATARLVNRMMQRTVTHGTARRTFFDPAGHPFLPGIAVAGKTGTLSAERPFRGYTWWVGFAPADDPQIAVAALVVNRPEWRIKASFVARETLRYWLVTRPH